MLTVNSTFTPSVNEIILEQEHSSDNGHWAGLKIMAYILTLSSAHIFWYTSDYHKVRLVVECIAFATQLDL